ncbi:hypothetical protein KF913_24130 [Candidatus Obscuribacterales bacterium]|nr:hypothetical protein [Candidatus Obscuribacterales bacterium]
MKLAGKLKIQDPLDVGACHGMGGAWGAVATGIFASKSVNPAGVDVAIHGNWSLLYAQLVTVAAVGAFTFVSTYVIAKVVDKIFHFTVTEEEQQIGLDAFHYGSEGTQEPAVPVLASH